MEFSRQEYCNELPFPSPGDIPDPGIEPGPCTAGAFCAAWATREATAHKGREYPKVGEKCKLSSWVVLGLTSSTNFPGILFLLCYSTSLDSRLLWSVLFPPSCPIWILLLFLAPILSLWRKEVFKFQGPEKPRLSDWVLLSAPTEPILTSAPNTQCPKFSPKRLLFSLVSTAPSLSKTHTPYLPSCL